MFSRADFPQLLHGARDTRAVGRSVVPPTIATIVTMAALVTMDVELVAHPPVTTVSNNLRIAPLGPAFLQGQKATDYPVRAAVG